VQTWHTCLAKSPPRAMKPAARRQRAAQSTSSEMQRAINQIEANFRKVTPALIQKTAKDYLRKTNRTVVILNVEKAAAAEGGVQ